MLDAKSLMEGLQPLFALKMFLNRFNDQNVRKVLRIVIICVITLQLFKILLIILARRRFALRKLRQRQLRGVLGHFAADQGHFSHLGWLCLLCCQILARCHVKSYN